MEHSEFINEIAAALAKAQGAITTAAKDKTNPFLKSSYADLASVMAAARSHLSANGLAVIQTAETTDAGVSVTTMLAHASGQWISGTMSMEASDEKGMTFAQVMGKIVTYLRRYGYMAITGVVADDEDDDGNGAQGRKSQPAPKAEAPKPEPTPAPKAASVNGDAQHWIKDDKKRAAFWARTAELGLTNVEVHKALGVEHVENFGGTIQDAGAAIRAYIAQQEKGQVEQFAAELGGVVAK